MQNRLLELILLGIWFCVAVIVYIQNDFTKNGFYVINKSLALSASEIKIKEINLLDNNLFEVTLQDNSSFKTILGKVEADSTEKLNNEIKNLFNSADNLKAVLLHKQNNGVWLMKINFNLNGKKISLKKWLIDRGLVKNEKRR